MNENVRTRITNALSKTGFPKIFPGGAFRGL